MGKLDNRYLVIDCQVFQTDAWHRGMGKYSLSLLSKVFSKKEMRNYKKIIFLFNKNLPITDECIDTLKSYCEEASFIFLPLANVKNKRIAHFIKFNKNVINEFLEDEFENDSQVDYLILSLFLGELTCVVFPDKARNILLFYDLIPFLYSERYKKRIIYDDYIANFNSIYEADLIYTISQTVANDLTVYLGISKDKLISIDGAPINRSAIIPKKPAGEFGSKFILMPSGDELRKNNLRAVKAFDRFNSTNRNQYKLVLTSFFSPRTIEELNDYSENLVFSGNVSEEELLWLYQNAELVLFATEYEGLGLPVLEAMTVEQKIACSDIPVFREISDTAFYYFDHMEPENIAEVIALAIVDNLSDKRKAAYKKALAKYTWDKTAEAFIKGLKALPKRNSAKTNKPRLAIFTPHPSGYSAIGKVVAESHAAIAEIFDVDYYFDYGLYHKEVRPDYLSSIATCHNATEFNVRRYGEYDLVIYHIGNSDYHLESIKNALYLPGYLILHDTFLQGAYSRTQVDGYMTEKRVELEKLLSEKIDPPTSNYLTSLVNASLGILCHSKYAESATKQILYNQQIPIHRINLPLSAPIASFPNRADSRFNIGFAGILADVKGLEIIEHIAHDLRFENCIVNLFGYDFLKPESIEILSKLPNVKLVTNPSDFEFQTLLAKQDILVNFRLEYRGETSLTVLEAMRYGVVPIVRNIGWYAELPDDVVVKVDSLDEVIDAIHNLVVDSDQKNKISRMALELIQFEFSHEQYAENLVKLIRTKGTENSNQSFAYLLKRGAPLKKLIDSLNV